MARFHYRVRELVALRNGEVYPEDPSDNGMPTNVRPVQLVPRLESTPVGVTLVLRHPGREEDVLFVALTDLDISSLAMQFMGRVEE